MTLNIRSIFFGLTWSFLSVRVVDVLDSFLAESRGDDTMDFLSKQSTCHELFSGLHSHRVQILRYGKDIECFRYTFLYRQLHFQSQPGNCLGLAILENGLETELTLPAKTCLNDSS